MSNIREFGPEGPSGLAAGDHLLRERVVTPREVMIRVGEQVELVRVPLEDRAFQTVRRAQYRERSMR